MYAKFFKRLIDFLLSGMAFLMLSPILLIFMIIGAIVMKGNPFFLQPRPGKKDKNGKEKIFMLVKFRTMSNKKDKDGKLLPDEDTQYEMYMQACKKLDDANYLQYEISNFAKKEYGCKHNIKYWTGKEYLSFGPSATSFMANMEYKYVSDIERYISCFKKESDIRETEYIFNDQELETRFLMTFFRLRAGISAEEYTRRFGFDFEERYGEEIAPFLRSKHLVKTTRGYRLTRKGMLVSNYILSTILNLLPEELE